MVPRRARPRAYSHDRHQFNRLDVPWNLCSIREGRQHHWRLPSSRVVLSLQWTARRLRYYSKDKEQMLACCTTQMRGLEYTHLSRRPRTDLEQVQRKRIEWALEHMEAGRDQNIQLSGAASVCYANMSKVHAHIPKQSGSGISIDTHSVLSIITWLG